MHQGFFGIHPGLYREQRALLGVLQAEGLAAGFLQLCQQRLLLVMERQEQGGIGCIQFRIA